jgi:hypothetical protein
LLALDIIMCQEHIKAAISLTIYELIVHSFLNCQRIDFRISADSFPSGAFKRLWGKAFAT